MTHKLNYIGAKAKLAQWICDTIVGILDAEADPRIADLFCGSGDMTIALRSRGFATISADAEEYATIITRAHATGTYTPRMRELIAAINALPAAPSNIGAIEMHYSASEQRAGRSFFTQNNARRIDQARAFIRDHRRDLTPNEEAFLIASLIVSADKVANIAAVYGAFLKTFKKSALAPFVLEPIHTTETPANARPLSRVRRAILPARTTAEMQHLLRDASAVYMDPPYNGRQYSKNYFVLNAIANVDADASALDVVEGSITGILADCYISPFCQVRAVRAAFETLFEQIAHCPQVRHIFISYSSESLVPIDDLCEIIDRAMSAIRGHSSECAVEEKEYRRFASSPSADTTTMEYLVHASF